MEIFLNTFLDLSMPSNPESEEDIAAEDLRLLQEREKQLEEFRAELRPALESLDRGEGIPLDVEDIKRRGRQRLAAEGKSF